MADEQEPKDKLMPVESEVGQSGMALMSMGATIMRLENETLVSMALQRPRVPRAVLAAALDELEVVPEEAGTMFYAIPYKERGADGTEKTVMVEGPSIKLANALGRLWGHCAVGSRIVGENPEGATVEGVFLDYETGYRVTKQMQVSRLFKLRKGGYVTLSAQRWVVALQAAASKAQRNAVLSGLPQPIINSVLKRAKAIVASGGKVKTTAGAEASLEKPAKPSLLAEAIAWFQMQNVSKEDLERAVECPVDRLTGGHIAKLRGMKTALQDGQTTIEEMFCKGPAGEGTGAEEKPKATEVPFTPEQAFAGGVQTQPKLL